MPYPQNLFVICLLSLGLVAGCSQGGSSGSSTATTGTSTGGTSTPGGTTSPGPTIGATANPSPVTPVPAVAPPGSATNLPQWQTALAALAMGPPVPLRFEGPAVAAYNQLIADAWPHVAPRIESEVEAALQQQIGQALNGISLLSLSSVQLDAAASPALNTSAPAPTQSVLLQLPTAPGVWQLEFDAMVGGTFPINIGGFTQNITLQAPLQVVVQDVRAEMPIDVDLSGPIPVIGNAGTPQIQLQIVVSSSNPLLNGLGGLLTQVLDPIVRAALTVGAYYAQWQLGQVQGMLPNSTQWGQGGQPLPTLSNGPNLDSLASVIADELQLNHMPFEMVYPAVFDQPHSGGQVVEYRHWGDSALWTGGYLAAESYRFDHNGDPRALAGAQRLVTGYELCSQVVPAPQQGLLARTTMPLGSPHALPLATKGNYFTGTVNGQMYAALGDTSRDSYTGTMFGLGQAYHRIPSLRGQIAPIVERLLTYLDTHGWTVYKAPNQTNNLTGNEWSVTFSQSPTAVLNFATIGNMIDPQQFGAMHQQMAGLSSMLWFPTWASAMEIHESYYKFNLGHMNLLSLLELETDPDRYRDYLTVLRVMRNAVAHHDNPWFNAVNGVALPPQAVATGQQVQQELWYWSQRPRRGFVASNSTNPNIAKTTYVANLPNANNSPSSPFVTGPRPMEVAVYPVPIPLRPNTSFVWSSSPFELDGYWADPKEQHPGIDLLLPLYISQNHGMLP